MTENIKEYTTLDIIKDCIYETRNYRTNEDGEIIIDVNYLENVMFFRPKAFKLNFTNDMQEAKKIAISVIKRLKQMVGKLFYVKKIKKRITFDIYSPGCVLLVVFEIEPKNVFKGVMNYE